MNGARFFFLSTRLFDLQKILDNMGHSLFFSRRANLFQLYRKSQPLVLNFSGYDGFRSSVR